MSSNSNTDSQEFQQNSIRDLTAEYDNIPHMGFVETLRIPVSYIHIRAHVTLR